MGPKKGVEGEESPEGVLQGVIMAESFDANFAPLTEDLPRVRFRL